MKKATFYFFENDTDYQIHIEAINISIDLIGNKIGVNVYFDNTHIEKITGDTSFILERDFQPDNWYIKFTTEPFAISID